MVFFGIFWNEMSKLIEYDNKVIGAILIVHKNSWDVNIIFPYIIELFIHRDHRNKGIAETLITQSCIQMYGHLFEHCLHNS